jgi:hypothetical protein
MATHDYHFISHWRVRGSIEEIAEILAEPLLLPRWWPSVYLGVRELAKGHPETSVGREIELFTKGWLPYTLTWRFRVTANRRPHGSSIAASGDLEGTGEWTLVQEGDFARVSYDWRVRADKPLLRWFSFLLKPLFAANHRWAMARGEESLALELRRRRAERGEESQVVPPPPPPTFAWAVRRSGPWRGAP